jgi:hypothetical protein
VAEALRRQPQRIPALGHGDDLPHQVSFFAPQVEGAAVVLRVQRRLRKAQVEDDLAVFQHGGLGMLREELLNLLGDVDGRLGSGWLRGWLVRGRSSRRRH